MNPKKNREKMIEVSEYWKHLCLSVSVLCGVESAYVCRIVIKMTANHSRAGDN